jgi:hypothetical protein
MVSAEKSQRTVPVSERASAEDGAGAQNGAPTQQREVRARVLHVVPPPPPPDERGDASGADVETLYLVRGEHLSPYHRELEGRYFLVNGLGIAGLPEGGFLTRSIADEVLSRWTVAADLLLARQSPEDRARALHRYVHQILRRQVYPVTPPRRRTVTSRRSPARPLPGATAPARGAVSAYLPLSLAEVCTTLGVTPRQILTLITYRVLRLATDERGESMTPPHYDFAGVAFWYETLYGRVLRGTPRPLPPPPAASARAEDGSVDIALLCKLYPNPVGVPAHARAPREGLHVAYHALLHALMDYYDVPERALTAPGRTPFMVEARAVAIHIMHQCWGMRVTQIADWLDRDHSTVMHHLRLYYYAPTPEFLDSLHQVKSRIVQYLP